MAWSKFYRFTEKEVEKNAPDEAGIYRIVLHDGKVFKLDTSGIDSWEGIKIAGDTLKKRIKDSAPHRVGVFDREVYTDLLYIGRSTEQTIKDRLLKHVKGEGNEAIKKLIKQNTIMFFSFRKSEDPDKAELNFYKEFAKLTGGYCPPCDCCSAECKSVSDNCIVTYRTYQSKRIKLC